jgi:acetylornithine deacetylase
MPTTLELLERLVQFDTTSKGSNLELLEFVEALLDRHGVSAERVDAPDRTRANLLARIGPPVEGGVVLSAHTDCVPVTGQPWSHDPFRLHHDGDRVTARGTSDMKGFIAGILAAVPRMAAADLQRPILLALSYDEELGTVGAPSLVDRLIETQPRPEAVIVGEPTSMEVVTAHKGVRSFTTVVDGVDAHSSQPHRASNAVVAAARVATFIADLADERRRLAADPRFDPPHTTVNVATIVGGQAINIVPRRCELAWEYRPVPADDSDELRTRVEEHIDREVLPRLRAETGRGDIETRPEAFARALGAELRGPAEELARALTGYRGPDRTVAFGTDGGHFQAAGLSTVVCGPGSIDQAHQPDEFIELEQLAACDHMIAALVDRCSR